ncbi:hypothetical protein HDU67_000565 [Dinochytrium kinnereticum]|nr:hypothetical protein HDU67_000565 [Dinochytrium kinnereticum]
MRLAANKNTGGGLQARPGANKPFMTEYKLAYRDPSMTAGRKGYGSVMGTIPRQRRGKVGVPPPILQPKDLPPPPPITAAVVAVLEKQQHKEEKLPSVPGGLGGVQLPFIEDRNTTARKHVSKRDIWNPPPPSTNFESTSLTLPGMVAHGTNQPVQAHFRRRRILGGTTKTGHSYTARYNIISGAEINGEPHSGYKEGRRAVIQSFAHIDSTTNARTPGYNIISNTDSRNAK